MAYNRELNENERNDWDLIALNKGNGRESIALKDLGSFSYTEPDSSIALLFV